MLRSKARGAGDATVRCGGEIAIASRRSDTWPQRVSPAARSFRLWIDALIDPASTPALQREAAHDWCAWVLDRLEMDGEQLDPQEKAYAQPTGLPAGEAISPQRAVLCLREHLRTAVFLRAVDAAVRAAQARFPGETIHVVEAGCGPAAPMASSVAARFAPAEVQVTLIDIHEASLTSARRLATELGVERSIRGAICGDAAAVRFAEPERPHVIVAEVLRRALKKEPQVAVTRALAPQLRVGGFFLPERIEVGPGILRGTDVEARVDYFGAAFMLDAGTTEASAPDATGRLPSVAVEVPAHARGQLALFTRLRVFREHTLGDFDCSLTLPERFAGPLAARACAGGVLRFAYEISSDPGLRLLDVQAVTQLGRRFGVAAG